MTNIAATLQKLQEKDKEKTTLQDDIDSLENIQREGSTWRLVVTVLEGAANNGKIQVTVNESTTEAPLVLEGKVCAKFNYFLVSFELNFNICFIQNPGEECEFKLTSNDATIAIRINWENSDEEGQINSLYILKTIEIPANETITTDVEPSQGSQKNIKIRVKASFDSVVTLIQQRKQELEQVIDQLNILKQDTKQKTKPQGTKKGPKKVNFQGREGETKQGGMSLQSRLAFAQEVAIMALAGAFEYRAVIFFGLTAAAISRYGDLASV